MSHFFNILRLSLDFDIGAYYINCKNHTQARLFQRPGLDASRSEDFKKNLLGRASPRWPDFTRDLVDSIEVSLLIGAGAGPPGAGTRAGHFTELPLFYKGEPSGLILLGSYGRKTLSDGSGIITEITLFINRALEGIFEHAFEEEKILADIMFSLNQGVYIADADGVLTIVNPKGSEYLPGFCKRDMGCVTRSGAGRLMTPGCSCEFSNLLHRTGDNDSGKRVYSEEVKDKDGRTFLFTISGLATTESSRYGYVITSKDITEEKLMQNRMLQSSKLASLGEMVAGIAHEINNPLQSMLLNIELFETVLEGGDERVRLGRIKDSVLRIKRIVKDLLIFARDKGTETESTDINTLVRKSVEMLRHQLKIANLTIRLDLDERPLLVKCNRNLFQQVIINLLQNAKDAIEESGKGSMIHIGTTLFPGKEVVVEVSDDGPGMPEEILDKVFDPFFTTKDIGKGTGLGLSVSRKIVENIGGAIHVSASPLHGAAFRITLPHQGVVFDERRKNVDREPDYSLLRDRSVLIVDDEKEVSSLISEAISINTSKIETASNGGEALEKIKASDFDFIFLDVRIPGMDGLELFRHIAKLKHHLTSRIVFITGDTETESVSEFLRIAKCRFLPKPFGVNDLLGTMSEMARNLPSGPA